MSGITFSEDLKIFISGLLHECIHFCKRKLYYLTCDLISREAFLNGEREEGGFIFEKIFLGWGDEDNDKDYFNKNIILKSKKINIEIALKILKEYLNEIGLNDSSKLKIS